MADSMTEFVGAEYLIARMLIAKQEQQITTQELNRLGICVRKLSFQEDVNVVFLTSRDEVYSAVYDYSDYFECIYGEDDDLSAIRIKEGKGMEDLNIKFINPLPIEITNLLDDAINQIIAA